MIKSKVVRATALGICLALALSFCGCGKKKNNSNEIVLEQDVPTGSADKLADYKNFTYEAFTGDDFTDEDVVAEYERIIGKYADPGVMSIEPVTGRDGTKTASGDKVFFKYSAVAEDGTVIAPRYGKITLGAGEYGFDEMENALLDQTVGEDVEFTAMVPENYGDAAVAGKQADFTVSILFVYEEAPITLENGCYYLATGSIDEAYASVRVALENSVINEKYEHLDKAFADFVSFVKENTTYKDIEKDKENSYWILYNSFSSKADAEDMTLEAYIAENSSYKNMDEFKTAMEAAADSHIKELVAFNAVADAEGITLSDEDYAAVVFALAQKEGKTVSDSDGNVDKDATVSAYETQYATVYGPDALRFYARVLYCETQVFSTYAKEAQ